MKDGEEGGGLSTELPTCGPNKGAQSSNATLRPTVLRAQASIAISTIKNLTLELCVYVLRVCIRWP